jgi:hypothetical protein
VTSDSTRVLLIVGGGIAAYKALEVTRLLRKAGVAVRPILTGAGARFVTPLSLSALAQEDVRGDLFSLDYVNVPAYPRHRTQFDERHRIVLSGIVGLPWDTRLSTLITLGTGTGYNLVYFDFFGPGLAKVLNYDGFQSGTFPYQDIDLQLGKDFQLGGGARVGLTVGVFNLTNHDNIDPGSINGNFFKGPNGPIPDQVFGTGGALLTQPRRLQLGLTVGF